MPHIHTDPGQHDITVSAYIVRLDAQQPRCLVHMHKKLGKLMQAGGHVELNETPWAAIVHELREETGYPMDNLQILQPTAKPVQVHNAVIHPVPVLFNTHKISDDHYHTDLCYAFTTTSDPTEKIGDGESDDLRWCTLTELRQLRDSGVALADSVEIYEAILEQFLPAFHSVETRLYSTDEPSDAGHLQ